VAGLPAELPGWATVRGIVTPPEALVYTQAADLLLGEGTSTMHEGAALRTPLVLVPGPIQEATLLGTGLGAHQAAHAFTIEQVTAAALASAFETVLTRPEARDAMTARALALVTGGGGVAAAARVVLEAAGRRRAAGAGPGSG
jgi:UDP-N-acetylglucosamine:LPS N-acetylglucosamine transferase